MTAPSSALIVPVGRLLGTLYTRSGSTEHHVTVRLGSELLQLDDDEFAIWWLCHGMADRAEDDWTEAAIAQAARDVGFTAAEPVIERLWRRGLVEEVHRTTPDAVEFAERYRMVPQLLGLGNNPEEPWNYQIGLFERPVIQLPGALYDLWRWAVVDEHLWNACQGAAGLAKQVGVTAPDEIDPELLLDAFLVMLHPLLSVQALHLDVRHGAPRQDKTAGRG